MRTLSATLTAAQKKADRLPYVEAKVYDYQQGIKLLSWTRLYTGGETDNHHGIAFDGQGDMHRIRADSSNKLYYQKIASPGVGSTYSSWTEIANDCQGPCAIAAYGAKVYIFYRTTPGNVIWKYYSHDYGVNWNNAQLIVYADVQSLSATWWSTTDNLCCLCLKTNEIKAVILDTSDQSSQAFTKTLTPPSSAHTILATYGLGSTYDGGKVKIVLAAKENGTDYDFYGLFIQELSKIMFNLYVFGDVSSFLEAAHGEDTYYEYPDCHVPSDVQSYEDIIIAAAEKFAGTTAYTRPLTSHVVKDGGFSSREFAEPRPFLDIATAYGLKLATDSSHWWLERPDGVWRAPRSAADALDLTDDIVSLRQRIPSPLTGEGKGEGALLIELDNSTGAYASPGSGALASLRFRGEVVLKLGYKTSAGDESSEAGTYWIDGWEWTSDPGQSTFRLFCLDGGGLADRWTSRFQMRWNKDAVDPHTVSEILFNLTCRWGIRFWNNPAAPNSTAIDAFQPDFTVNPRTAGDSAIRRLLSFVPDAIVYYGSVAYTKDLVATEASCYTYKFENDVTTHPILAGDYGHHTPTPRTRAIGRDAGGARIVADAFDWDLLDLGVDVLDQDYDPNLDDATRTQERADALLRKSALRAASGTIIVPANVGQELFDVVTLTDVRCGISSEKYRIVAIRTDYDRRKGIYRQTLHLTAP